MQFHRLPLTVLPLGLACLVACGQGGRNASSFPKIPAGGDTTIASRTGLAFTQPAANLTAEDLARHASGDAIFEASFASSGVINPGLGPAFNNNACQGCHVGNGRGTPVLGKSGSVNSPMLVRVSLDPLRAAEFPAAVLNPPGNGPIAVPGLGIQLQDQATVTGIAEVKIALSWAEVSGAYDDGTTYSLRYPVLSYSGQEQNVQLMNNPAVLRSLRQTPPVIGLGLLEAVSEETLLSMEDPDDSNGDGIRGHANRVWDPQNKKLAIGRFGWKASAPTLLDQTAAAFVEDMGVHNFIFPDADGSVEITEQRVINAAFYTQTLAVPDRDRVYIDSREGEKLFHEIGCASCHRPVLQSGSDHPIAALRNQTFAPYTDLLLHDMGPGLADNRSDFTASGTEWRTPPLWGLGLTHTLLTSGAFLHDGRARTTEEAILWHGGEAGQSQRAFKELPESSRAELLKFLLSL